MYQVHPVPINNRSVRTLLSRLIQSYALAKHFHTHYCFESLDDGIRTHLDVRACQSQHNAIINNIIERPREVSTNIRYSGNEIGANMLTLIFRTNISISIIAADD